MNTFDVVILTESRYLNPIKIDDYIQNVLTEDHILVTELEKHGLKVTRKCWDDPKFDWNTTKVAVFRSIWDYHKRLPEFLAWMKKVELQTEFINPISQIRWNLDKWYLRDIQNLGVNVVETYYIKKGEKNSLSKILKEIGWNDAILKPTVAATARHTYRINPENVHSYEELFSTLIFDEDLMLQPFQFQILEKGEISFVIIDGKFTHAVLKRAKPGDFRVQDDFGGTLNEYHPTNKEIEFAESVVTVCDPLPAYARVDVMWDNEGQLAVSEIELIEPELWFRRNAEAAGRLAEVIKANF